MVRIVVFKITDVGSIPTLFVRIRKLIVNKKKRQVVYKNELQQIFLKFLYIWLIRNNNKNSDFQFAVSKLLFSAVDYKSYFSSVKNICLFSGRTRSIVRNYKISRIKFNEFMTLGKLPG